MAGIAGSLNAAGFQATGFFSANMTGNISALSDHLGLAQLGWAALFSSLVAAFIAGAFVSGLLIEAGRKHAVRAIYAYSIVLEAALLVALSLIDVFLPAAQSGSILVLGLSFIMGVQNAATTRISNARVRTTHVSGMATDIGIGLALLANNSPERANVVALLRLHVSTITSFVVGGIAGVVIYLAIGDWLLLVCAVLLFAISLPEARRASRDA
ncbi:MAG: YoaK family protein [Mesorhizobium sp.]